MTKSPANRFPVIGRFIKSGPRVAVLRLEGTLHAGSARRALSLHNLESALQRAFAVHELSAVALVINSPGGSPVQASLITQRIRQLAEKHEVEVLAFVEDVAASGGYWVAAAADEIYADSSSIIGSIGVISAGFGLNGLIGKIGVERRVHTSGERKSALDPFLPERPEDLERLDRIMSGLHETFIETVRDRRGARLAEGKAELFTGDFWLAPEAMELGLIDGVGNIHAILQEKFGEKVKLKQIEIRRGMLMSWLGADAKAPASRVFGASMPEQWADALVGRVMAEFQEQVIKSRFGL